MDGSVLTSGKYKLACLSIPNCCIRNRQTYQPKPLDKKTAVTTITTSTLNSSSPTESTSETGQD